MRVEPGTVARGGAFLPELASVHTWISKYRQRGSVKALPRKEAARTKAMEQRLKEVSLQNDQLKRLLAEKELELAILREIRDHKNPQ
jgi:hypothetical protein